MKKRFTLNASAEPGTVFEQKAFENVIGKTANIELPTGVVQATLLEAAVWPSGLGVLLTYEYDAGDEKDLLTFINSPEEFSIGPVLNQTVKKEES